MTFIEKQQAFFDQMVNIVFNETDNEYDTCYCEYEYLPQFSTISLHFGYEINGIRFNSNPSPEASWKNFELAEDLRQLVKDHTGAEWSSFVLKLDKDGKAHIKFEYHTK